MNYLLLTSQKVCCTVQDLSFVNMQHSPSEKLIIAKYYNHLGLIISYLPGLFSPNDTLKMLDIYSQS